MMRTLFSILLLLSLVIFPLSAQQKSAQPRPAACNRYQLFQGQYEAPGQPSPSVFLLDTETGEVSEYLPYMKKSDGTYGGGYFVSIPVKHTGE